MAPLWRLRQATADDREFDPGRWQIIEVGGHAAGMVHVADREDDVMLVNIRIAPELQNHGIGTSVIRSVVDQAAAAGKPVVLQVLKVNERARALYEREGFHVIDKTETHVRMRREADRPRV